MSVPAMNHFFFHIATSCPDYDGDGFPPLLYHRVVGTSVLKITGTEPKVDISTYVDFDPASESTLVDDFFDKLSVEEEGARPYQMVSFRGNTFGLPVLMYRAVAHGVDASPYMDEDEYFEPRFAKQNVDLSERLTNFNLVSGSSLNEYAKLIGLPGRPYVNFVKLIEDGNEQGIRGSLDIDVLLIALIYLRLTVAHGVSADVVKEVGKRVMKAYYNYNERVQEYLDGVNVRKVLLAE